MFWCKEQVYELQQKFYSSVLLCWLMLFSLATATQCVSRQMATFHKKIFSAKMHKSSSCLLLLVPKKVIHNVMCTISDSEFTEINFLPKFSHLFIQYYFPTQLCPKSSKRNRNCIKLFLQACFLPDYVFQDSED